MLSASKEDIEYFECQDEMNNDLLEQHKIVERIIGIKHVLTYIVHRMHCTNLYCVHALQNYTNITHMQ